MCVCRGGGGGGGGGVRVRVNECVYVWFELADVREGGGSDLFADGFVGSKNKKNT